MVFLPAPQWHQGADALLAMDIDALARSVSASVLRLHAPLPRAALELALRTAHTAQPAVLTGSLPTSDPCPAQGSASSSAAAGSAAAGKGSALTLQAGAGGRVVTVIAPHDVTWEPTPPQDSSRPAACGTDRTAAHVALAGATQAHAVQAVQAHGVDSEDERERGEAFEAFLSACADALRGCARGKAALYIGGDALLQDGEAACPLDGMCTMHACMWTHAYRPSACMH